MIVWAIILMQNKTPFQKLRINDLNALIPNKT